MRREERGDVGEEKRKEKKCKAKQEADWHNGWGVVEAIYKWKVGDKEL